MSIRYIRVIKIHVKGMENTLQDVAEECLTNVEDMPMNSAYLMAIRSA